MDCLETRTALTAFHDGELPAVDRPRVEEHLRGCPECATLLVDLARVDRAAGVPDPGPAYWERFNARLMDRVEREADGPKVATLRPKGGWMRQQLRYLVPAAAAAALVVVVVRYGGMNPGAPIPSAPPAVGEPSPPVSQEPRRTRSESEPRATKKAGSAGVARRVPEDSTGVAEAPAVSPPPVATGRFAAAGRDEGDRLADHSSSTWNVEAPRDRAAAPAAMSAPSPAPPMMTYRGAPVGSPSVGATDGMSPGMRAERKRTAGAAALMAERHVAAKAESASGMRVSKEAAPASPCELASTLAERERYREAEAAQRACLAEDLPDPAREKGLVFLAELLDRQAVFAEADAVIAEVDRRFPRSRTLDLYRQKRPMVQKGRE